LFLLLTATAFSQIAEMPAAVDERAAEYFGEGKPVVGGVIGVVNGNTRYAKGYGRVSLDDDAVPDIDTVYEIASLSKPFTGVLLGEMVARGEVALDDTLDRFVPEGSRVPRFRRGETVTLRQLATHRSGLPRLPTDFWEVAATEPDNPYKFYTGERIERFLHAYRLTVAPGTRYEYSNLGASVLGYVMERKTGLSYEQLVQERICRPLGMTNTAVELTETMQAKLAPPYDAKKQPAKNWDLPGFAAGGGLRSSMRDLLAFAQAAAGGVDAFPDLAASPDQPRGVDAFPDGVADQPRGVDAFPDGVADQLRGVDVFPDGVAPSDHPLVVGMKVASTPHSAEPAVGLGWHINGNGDLTHNGQTGGYHSYIVVSPKSQRAVVLLTNTAVGDPDRLGEALWNAFDSCFP